MQACPSWSCRELLRRIRFSGRRVLQFYRGGASFTQGNSYDDPQMMSFPISWNYEPPGTLKTGPSGPYSGSEVAEYLLRQHYHWVTKEAPLELDEPAYLTELDTRDRHFWLWQTRDQSGRIWNVVVGSGRSPFVNDDRHCHRWIYAKEADDVEPSEFLSREMREHQT
jgi:hypothetical protein